jgi:septum formation protein
MSSQPSILKPVILASASPRRRNLLKEIIPDFKVRRPNIKENIIAEYLLNPERYTQKLARAKAFSVAAYLKNGLVIGADTVVFTGNEIIGKPGTHSKARLILRKLSGTKHWVITGVCVVNAVTGRAVSGYAKTTLRMKKLTPQEIESIASSSKHYAKAGGYAIQEEGDRFIRVINGSMDNAVGLPLKLVKRLVKKISS